MLVHLHIENVAVIDNISVDFKKGLNILTGETGAGKSIIIDAINMVLGERTSRDLIRAGQEKAIVEALFQISCSQAINELEKYGLFTEEDNTLLISRQMTVSGRNVCRINGNIVTSSILKEVSKYIINIHGQHDNQALLDAEKHVDFLDAYVGSKLLSTKKHYQQLLDNTNKLKSAIKKLDGDEQEKNRKIDLLQFQMREIDKAKLVMGEEENLEKEQLLFSNAEKIMYAASNAYQRLYGDNKTSVHDSLADIVKQLGEVKQYDETLVKHYTALEEISFQIDELVHEIRDYRDAVEFDPDLLAQTEQRLDLIYNLKRKYGVNIEEILAYRQKIGQELEDLNQSEEKKEELEKELVENIQNLTKLGEQLYDCRVSVAKVLEQKIVAELHDLNMEKTNFKVDVSKQYDAHHQYKFMIEGLDKVEFLISTNPGEPLKPLVKIASGGEMSRIMLAIKTVLADTDAVNTLIFDEIDMGVSGRAAQKIAEKLLLIAYKKQILCITHLPQLASMADNHYLIEKNILKDKSSTTVTLLDQEKRKTELARIIGGAVVTDLTLQNAQEMITMASQIKEASKKDKN